MKTDRCPLKSNSYWSMARSYHESSQYHLKVVLLYRHKEGSRKKFTEETRGKSVKYHFKVHKESRGYWAECVELKGCRSEGNSLVELRQNAAEALNLFLSEPADSKLIFTKPRTKVSGKNIFSVKVEPSIAIANRIREIRLKNELTQNAMKDRLGIRNLSNYQRLEDPLRANPEWATLLLIKAAFPDFRVDDLMG